MPRKRKSASASASGSRSANKRKTDLKSEPAEEAELAASTVLKEEDMNDAGEEAELAASAVKKEEETNDAGLVPSTAADEDGPDAVFVGDPVPDEEARKRWPKRYEKEKSAGAKSKSDSDNIILARRHYTQAKVDGCTLYMLYDDAHVKAEEGSDNYICKIVEMFEAVDGKLYFTAQWYYRAKDTVIKNLEYLIDPKRVFFSEIRDDNPLDCLVAKLNIARIPLNESGSESSSTISSDVEVNGKSEVNYENMEGVNHEDNKEPELRVLDLYSGCGAMSTGLCLGGILSGFNLVTRWAVDLNEHACESLKLNHPETQVRNESAENFLSLLKEWEKLCSFFSLVQSKVGHEQYDEVFKAGDDDDTGSDEESDDVADGEVFEVFEVLDICYGDPNNKKEQGLYFKVRWKGYGPNEDTWEPISGLSNCRERIKEFVTRGFKSNMLPLPGQVDVICGGPPCQGISGFNRFRNRESPLDDEKNKQLIVYMDIVQYLQPRFSLMENVVDLLKFAEGFLGRYALGRLLKMNYQSRMGIMAAGAYGLPQFRLRVFLWGAKPSEKLPQFPLPTHDVIVRGVIPLEFEINTVAHDEGHQIQLEKKLLLEDAISDLPSIENDECRDEMPYDKPAKTDFQRFIRLTKSAMLGLPSSSKTPGSLSLLYDHRPLGLNVDDYQRVCRIPKKKGACFRDLPGVRVRPDNKVEWDPAVERIYLDSGKPLVPSYAMTFVKGSSSKPFARLWWDETIPTVVTRAEPHNQAILHPEQDRVLSIRENARLQGFPDYYKLCGPVKERYIQVGNAVAVPVARALGYTLGLAFQGSTTNGPLYKLPEKFPMIRERVSSVSSEDVR
ncbi:hypothetical protein PIB30_033578 [Stylosanthes scabra]|uniref:Cytosine-specific methyltransferase n=1 Tax=Stylosanthes scabra TaxID=79078 RepID=A0ABU6XCQ9_9FABA|nr:hypothetical protein [Stylosanthes scabra]